MSKLLDYDGLSHYDDKIKDLIATIRLGKGQDGYVYIFVAGEQQGYGFDPSTGDIIVPTIYGDVVSGETHIQIPMGSTGTLLIKLSRQPSTSQAVDISSRSEYLTVSTNRLTFTEANWDTWQSVTLTNAFNEIGSLDTTVVMGNSDPLMTETTIPVTLNGITYESLVDTTIPSGAHTVTPADFATVTKKAHGLLLQTYNAQYSNIYVPATMEYDGNSYNVALKGADTFKGNTTIEYVEMAAGIGVNEYGTSATDRDWTSLFYNCTNLIGVKYNGTDITSLANAFYGCSKLKFFDGLDRQVNAINLSQAFFNCTSLEYIQDLSGSNINNLQATFKNCSSLVRVIGLPETISGTNVTNTFNGCSSLTYCSVPAGVTNVTFMFNNCTALRRIDCIVESGVTNGINNMLYGCSNLNVYCVANSEFYTQMLAQYGSSATIHILTEEGELPNIVVWGDSDSSPNKGWKEWPKRLMEMIEGFNLKNQAVAGEFTASTAARQGGNALTVNSFTIPTTTNKVQITLIGGDGQTFGSNPVFSAGGDFNPCTIGTVKGIITTTSGVNYFSRLESGTATQVAASTAVTSNNDGIFNNEDAVMLINLGNNAGWQETPSLLLNQVKMMLNHFVAAGGTKYIISGPFASTYTRTASGINTISQYEALAAEEFGSHWLNIRQYLITNGLTQNNLTASSTDTERIAAGQVPGSLLGGGTTTDILMYPTTSSDDAHVNAYGSNSIALAYYQKGIALGYWE